MNWPIILWTEAYNVFARRYLLGMLGAFVVLWIVGLLIESDPQRHR